MTETPTDDTTEGVSSTSVGNLGGGTSHVTTASPFSPQRQYHTAHHAPNYSGSDWLNEHAAKKLAQQIKVYWAKRGKDVQLTVEAFKKPDTQAGSGWFAIRSNMVGGRPV